MKLTSYFDDFLHDIRPDDEQRIDYQAGHTTLRNRMRADQEISEILVGDFLQGSYRRSTAIKPKGDQKSDVDIVVVTTIPDSKEAEEVADQFESFLNRHADYRGKFERKTHSIGISLSEVEMDLVITSAPSEAIEEALAKESERTGSLITRRYSPADFETLALKGLPLLRDDTTGKWKSEPLHIPNFDDCTWGRTDPLTQIAWTTEHNADCDGHYVNVVKALKWWRRTKCSVTKHPKGYPVEHVIGDFCRAEIDSVAEGVVVTLEGIRDSWSLKSHVWSGTTPFLPDRGIEEHNVWKRINPEDFATFMGQVSDAATIAREALDSDDVDESARRWHDLFGDPFRRPEGDNGARTGGFQVPAVPASPRHGRFA